ncbi:MAG: hypothetical protein HQK75_13575 [Candidatus Magnetomorum sp.]|nr:hypothetical protein [Candidatus Magnetomorum sp.]
MDINTNIQATTPIRKGMEVIRVDQNKTAQKQVQDLSEPLKIPVFEDFSLEISQLSKKMQALPSMSRNVMRDLSSELLKEKSGQEEVEQLFQYGKENERLQERLKKRIEEEFEQFNRVEPEPAKILFDMERDITTTPAIRAAENMEELIDVTGLLAEDRRIETGEPKKENQTPTEKIRSQMGGYIDSNGLVPEEERLKNTTPVEAAKESQEQLKNVTGKLIDRPEQWQVEGNKPEKTPAEKGRENLGGSVDKNGVLHTDANKTFPERAEERLTQLNQKMGELIDKPKELTGKEKTDQMTPAEKANKALGNPSDKKEKTPPERAEEKMSTMIGKMGERVDKHEKITGKEIDDDMTAMEKAKKRMGNRLDGKGVVPDDERKKPPPEQSKENMENMIEMMGQRVDKSEALTGKKETEDMSETERVRNIMGGRTDVAGVVPEDQRGKQPPERAQEKMTDMIEKMGENVSKTEELTGEKDTEKMSEMQKAKDLYGGRLNEKGVVPDEDREKPPVEASKEKINQLQEKLGELVDKREELTGKENREKMTETQKANEDMGNYLNKDGVASEKERDHSAVDRIEKRLEEMDQETGRLVEEKSELADSRVAPIADRLTGSQQRDFVATAQKLDQAGGPNMDKFISTTHQLIEKREDEQLQNYLSGAQDQSGVAMSMYLSAAAQRHLFT